jgi:hypothetical protein
VGETFVASSSISAAAQGGSPDKAGASSPGAAPISSSSVSAPAIQQILDQAVGFNLFAVPDQRSRPSNGVSEVFGSAVVEKLHRFDVVLASPAGGVQATNTLGELVGSLELQWFIVPDDFLALPDRRPPSIPLDADVSQRFVMPRMTFTFGEGKDGFRSFGTGRTFPTLVGNQPRIVVSAIANVTETFGRFRNHEGNFTICGDLTPSGFKGDILVRFQDLAGDLRAQGSLPAIQPQRDPDPQTTYLLWAGMKDEEQPRFKNHFSFGPDAQVRGLNITTQLKILELDFAVAGQFRGQGFSASKKIVGLEIGFGRGSVLDATPAGTALSPFLFEGVAQYSFFDGKGSTVGALLTNVTEGRRFDMQLAGVPGNLGWRFGFFGPIIYGTGCFEGAQGIFYGSSGSVFYSPPEGQIVTHFYMARINDPDGRFRVAASRGGWF